MSFIGERVRSLRKAKGWTLKELASMSGVSAPFLSEFERGEKGAQVDTIENIAEALEVPLSLLVDKEVDDEHFGDVITLLSDLRGLPPEKIELVRQMIRAIQ